MTRVLVTGGTGVLGRALTPLLAEAGAEVRILSRQPRPADQSPETWDRGDLRRDTGVSGAVRGIDTIVHCATGRDDLTATHHLARAAEAAGVGHLVYISIVGVDKIPFAYYRTKYACEQLLERSAVPHTIFRATQFHDLVVRLLSSQRPSPVLFTPAIPIQPIDVREVARRLAQLAVAEPAGRVEDLGGPEVLSGREVARTYLDARSSRRKIVPIRLPGAAFAAFQSGYHLAGEHRAGGATFAQYVSERAAA